MFSEWVELIYRQSKMIDDLQGVVDFSKSEVIIS